MHVPLGGAADSERIVGEAALDRREHLLERDRVAAALESSRLAHVGAQLGRQLGLLSLHGGAHRLALADLLRERAQHAARRERRHSADERELVEWLAAHCEADHGAPRVPRAVQAAELLVAQ